MRSWREQQQQQSKDAGCCSGSREGAPTSAGYGRRSKGRLCITVLRNSLFGNSPSEAEGDRKATHAH